MNATVAMQKAMFSVGQLKLPSQRMSVTSTSASPTPRQHHDLIGTIAPGWHIRYGLPVSIVKDDDGTYVVSDYQFAVYGTGDTGMEALGDFKAALIEYYEILAQKAANDPDIGVLFEDLRFYLQRS